ncbi:MAG: carbon-nitrogen hydrolase family protein [Bacteroidota bacterium]
MSQLKVALIQAEPVFFNLDASLNKAEEWVSKAKAKGAELILFPETFLPGYPRGLSFGTVVGSRAPEGRDHWLDYWNNSVQVPGPATMRLSEMARSAEAWLVMGITEQDPKEGSLYCSLLYFNPKGELVHKHRKLKPTAAERIVWGEGDGSSLKVLTTEKMTIGGLICWENYMPLARLTLFQQGIQVYLAPTADERDSWQATMRHIALEGRCFVLGCNQYVRLESYPEPYASEIDPNRKTLSRGGSVIVSPLGEILAGPIFDQEAMLTATLDLNDCHKGKLDFSAVGHYARPDVFEFAWKKAPNS